MRHVGTSSGVFACRAHVQRRSTDASDQPTGSATGEELAACQAQGAARDPASLATRQPQFQTRLPEEDTAHPQRTALQRRHGASVDCALVLRIHPACELLLLVYTCAPACAWTTIFVCHIMQTLRSVSKRDTQHLGHTCMCTHAPGRARKHPTLGDTPNRMVRE